MLPLKPLQPLLYQRQHKSITGNFLTGFAHQAAAGSLNAGFRFTAAAEGNLDELFLLLGF